MAKSKLHLISHSFPNQVSPYDATFISDHASALSEDFQVHVTVPTPRSIFLTRRFRKNHSQLITPEKVSSERCHYLSFPKRMLPSLIQRSISKQVLKRLSHTDPDLIHLHYAYPSGLLIPELKKHLDAPIILTIHGSNFYKSINKPTLHKILGNSLDQADKIIAVGPALEKHILNEFPHLKQKVRTIHNFVDTGFFQLKYQKEANPSGNDPGRPFRLLTVANLRYTKGIDTLIDAINLISDKVALNLTVIGRLNDEPEFKKSIFTKIRSLDLRQVNFIGPKNRTEVLEWLHRSDGFVLPSRREAFGISLIEAMACGLPVVSTLSGGPEAILSDEWGFLVDPEDPQQLADAIHKMTQLDSFDARSQHRYIEENFGKERYVKEYTELYDQLLSK